MNKRSLPAVLLILLIALQSVVASADVHALFKKSNEHNDLALEHTHGENASLHGHTANTAHDSTNTHKINSEQISVQESDSNCDHCCHCHNPSPASALLTNSPAENSLLNLKSLRPTYHPYSKQTSPILRPPITTV